MWEIVDEFSKPETFKRGLMFQHLLKEMEEVLGCWKSFLLPLTKDPKLSIQAQLVCRALSARGVTVGVEMLKVLFFFFFLLLVYSRASPHFKPLTPSCLRLCSQQLLCFLRKILKDLHSDFRLNGTRSVIIFYNLQSHSCWRGRNPKVT